MNNTIEKVSDSINDIIQKNEDAILGYSRAAENAKEVGLQNYFQTKIRERSSFINELKAAVPELDTRAGVHGSVKGLLHRKWMDTKIVFSLDSDEAILEEAIRGDKAAIEEYDEILEDNALPTQALTLIRKQRDWIKNDLKQIKTMEDVW